MSTLRETLQNLVNRSDEEKLTIILESYSDLLPVLRQVDPQYNGVALATGIMHAAVAADGKLHRTELAIMDVILNASGVKLEPEEILKMVQSTDTQSAHDLTVALAERLNEDLSASLILFVAGICSLDDRITPEEVRFIEELL